MLAIAYTRGKVFAGGSFTDAGGSANADFLAVWDGQSWAPFCTSVTGAPSFDGNVRALQVVGDTLYVGGEFHGGAGIGDADFLVACDLNNGAASPTLPPGTFPSGPVLALTADSNGVLYAGGRFLDLAGAAGAPDPAADNVAYLANGSWHAMGSGVGNCSCALDGFVRSLTASGTDVYVGTDVVDVAGIAQADHVARWNGSEWRAVGSDATGADGWFPRSAFIYALASDGSRLYATGAFTDAGGDPTADNVAVFDASAWRPVGSDGAGNGPWSGEGHALAISEPNLYAGGSFTSAGGDTQARSIASFPLSVFTPQPTPTPTPIRDAGGDPHPHADADADPHADDRHHGPEDHGAAPLAHDVPGRAVRPRVPGGRRARRREGELHALRGGHRAIHDRAVHERSPCERPVRQADEPQPRPAELPAVGRAEGLVHGQGQARVQPHRAARSDRRPHAGAGLLPARRAGDGCRGQPVGREADRVQNRPLIGARLTRQAPHRSAGRAAKTSRVNRGRRATSSAAAAARRTPCSD